MVEEEACRVRCLKWKVTLNCCEECCWANWLTVSTPANNKSHAMPTTSGKSNFGFCKYSSSSDLPVACFSLDEPITRSSKKEIFWVTKSMATLGTMTEHYLESKATQIQLEANTFRGTLETCGISDRPAFRCDAKSAVLGPVVEGNYSNLRPPESIYWILSRAGAPFPRNSPFERRMPNSKPLKWYRSIELHELSTPDSSVIRSKFNRDNSGKMSGTSSGVAQFGWMYDTNSFVMLSESDKNFRICCGELNPFWNSDRRRHHSLPFLQMETKNDWILFRHIFAKTETYVGNKPPVR